MSGANHPDCRVTGRNPVKLRPVTQQLLFLASALLGLGTSNVWSAPAPANDRFANRITLAGTNVSVSGSNNNATKDAGEQNHAGNPGGKSVWWTWTAPAGGEVTITTEGSDFDTLLAVYIGAAVDQLTPIASNDDRDPSLTTSRVRFPVTGGTNYHIAIDGFNDGTSADSGRIVLTLSFISQPIPRPANDNFANAIALAGSSLATTGSNVLATREAAEPIYAGKLSDTSVWWTWTPPVGGAVTITTEGTGFDTLLGVYTGPSLSNLTLVAENDDVDPLSGMLFSRVTFDTAAGLVYRVAVDGFDGASGQIVLTINTRVTRLSEPVRLPDGTFRFILNSVPGRTNQIQASTDLRNWSVLRTLRNTNQFGIMVMTDTNAAGFPKRFYRATLR